MQTLSSCLPLPPPVAHPGQCLEDVGLVTGRHGQLRPRLSLTARSHNQHLQVCVREGSFVCVLRFVRVFVSFGGKHGARAASLLTPHTPFPRSICS